MTDQLHPSSAPTTSGGESAIDQVADLLAGEAEPEQQEESVDYEAATDTEEFEETSGEYEDGDAESEDPNSDDDQFEGDEEGLAALASELGLDSDKLGLDQDGNVVVRLKVSGEEKQVTLSEAISGSQYRAANDQKAQQLAEQRKEFDTERQAVAEEYAGRLQTIQAMGQMLEQQLLAEYNNVDWEALKTTDPSKFLITQQEFQQKQQQLHHAGQALGEQMRHAQDQQEQQFQEERSEILAAERVAMVESVPEWNDTEVMKSDLAEIVQYGQSLGFSEEDLSNVIHNRELQVLRKAMLFDRGQTVAEKKSKTPPKMQRAANGRFVAKKDTKLNRLVERAKNAKGGEKRDAQADAVLAILGE